MSNLTQAEATRRRIIDAADEINCRLGPGRLSLDAVAAEAGVSKGGLLYHFPSKEKLLRALVQHHVSELRAAIERSVGCCGHGPKDLRLAYVRAMREKLYNRVSPPGILAVLAADPALISPFLDLQREILDKAFRGEGERCSEVIAFLAIQGLAHLKLMNPALFGSLPADKVFDAVEALLAD